MKGKNDVPHGRLVSVDTENDDNDCILPAVGLQNDNDIVYNEGTEMSSFRPNLQCQQQEIEAVQQQLLLTVIINISLGQQ